MKWILTTICVLMLQISFAQTPYLGGEGDGYATAELSFDVINSTSEFENKISIYPTIAKPNQSIEINTFEEIKSVTIVDMSGKTYLAQASRNIKLPHSIQSGLYTLIIALRDGIYYSKIVVIGS